MFNFNPFNKNKNEAPKKPIAETAKNIAGDAAKLSAAAMALAGMLDATNLEAKNINNDAISTNKIEMAATEKTIDMNQNLSWEDAKKLNHEIDSIQNLKNAAENADINYKKQIAGAHAMLDQVLKKTPNHEKFSNVYQNVEKFIRESAKHYDLSTGLEKFRTDMQKAAFDTKYNNDQSLTTYGINRNTIENKSNTREIELSLVNNIVNDIFASQYIQEQNKQISQRDTQLKTQPSSSVQ